MHALRRALPLVLLSLAAAFAIHRSLACPVFVPPQPLRSLYKFSDRIVVARVGQSLPVKVEGGFTEMRTALHVTQNLKGGGDAVAHYYHWTAARAAEDPQELELVRFAGGRPAPRFKEGDTLLVFLDKRKEGDGYEVNDAGYGVKKLSDDDLKIYVKRIDELAAITRSQPEDKGAIAEWLVRCAEERATRWDGAFELMLSAQAVKRQRDAAEKQKAEEKKKGGAQAEGEEDASEDASGDAGEAGEEAEQEAEADEEQPDEEEPSGGEESGESAAATSEAPPAESPDAEEQRRAMAEMNLIRSRYTAPDPSLIARLDEAQKRRLADSLFSVESVGEDEEPLLHVVSDFGDARLPAFLVSQMRRVEDAPHYAVEGWLGILADAVEDKELEKLVDDYRENATYGEEYYEEQSAEDEAQSESSESSAEEAGGGEEAEEESAEDIEAERAKLAAYEKRADEKRSERLKKLLAHAEAVLAGVYIANK